MTPLPDSAFVHAFGAYLPDQVVDNQQLASKLERTPEWIEQASGIRERRRAAPEETAAGMAVKAAQDCLCRAGKQSSSLGMLMVSSGSAAQGFPGPAAEVAAKLGLEGTPALDIPIASAGTLFGLVLAANCAAQFGDVLVIGSEKMSAVVDQSPLDPNTAILFGDGAGAALVSSQSGTWRVGSSALHSDGQFREDLKMNAQGLTMNGLSVIMQASRKLPAVIQEVLAAEGLTVADIGMFLVHQANQNLLTRVGKALSADANRIFSNISRYGNTSSASVLIAASEYVNSGDAKGPLVLAAFGAGFHWGAMVLHQA